jgi:hypothetical protein
VLAWNLTSVFPESRWGGSVSLRDARSGPSLGRRLSPETKATCNLSPFDFACDYF